MSLSNNFRSIIRINMNYYKLSVGYWSSTIHNICLKVSNRPSLEKSIQRKAKIDNDVITVMRGEYL